MTRRRGGRFVRPLAVLGLVVAGSAVPAAPAAATGAVPARGPQPTMLAALNPVADAWVESLTPTVNHGESIYLKVDGLPLTVSYLRFEVRGADSPPTGLLRLHVETASSTGIEIHSVAGNAWDENTITYENAPPIGPAVGSSGPVAAGTWVSVDVSSAITGDGPLTLAVTTGNDTGVRITSREGIDQPELVVPAPPNPSPYLVTRVDATVYRAVSQVTGSSYQGTLKAVVESAATELDGRGGGTITFGSGTFNLGEEFFKLVQIRGVTFAGAGVGLTFLRNSSSVAADTEPFNTKGVERMTVRDLTVTAAGASRTTSDALDFDDGVDVLVERVRVNASRGRGIIFDGKNQDWSSNGNVVRDCVVTGTASHGIELLASSRNSITGCTIANVGGHGIQINRSSSSADQPNKPADRNVVTGNVINQAGMDGINLDGGTANQIMNNDITNSSDAISSRDGVRITTSTGVVCTDNIVAGNIATDTQAIKTQRYGLNISTSSCVATVVGPGNDFSGNRSGAVRDVGIGTVYQ